MEKAYDVDREAEPWACESGGLELVPFFSFSFLLYLFVMNDREIPRNKFDSTLMSFDPCES